MKDSTYLSHLVRRLKWSDIDEKYVAELVKTARAEDIEGAGLAVLPKVAADITTRSLTPSIKTTAALCARRDMVVCGMELVRIVLKVYEEASDDFECKFTPLAKDGDKVSKGAKLGVIEGSARVILQAERIMLNFLQRLSGVSTETAKYVEALGDSPTKLLDTRKTTPGMRVLDKMAVKLGGGENHRMGLFDMVILKDNHIDFAGGITAAVEQTKVYLEAKGKRIPIEVEVRSLDDVREVLRLDGVDRIMLDNFTPALTREAVELIAGRCEVESSGGITLDNLREYAACGVDFISVGALTHQIKSLDLSLKAC